MSVSSGRRLGLWMGGFLVAFSTFIVCFVLLAAVRENSRHDNSSCRLSRDRLVSSSAAGDTPRVRSLLADGTSPDTTDERGRTALYCAVDGGQADTVRVLLDHRADANRWSHESASSPLDLPLVNAMRQRSTGIVRALIEHGADANGRPHPTNDAVDTPLTVAVDRQWVEGIELLLNAGADVNQVSRGYTQLARAAGPKAKPEVVRMLLDRGADPNKRGGSGCLDLSMMAAGWGDRPGCDTAVGQAAQGDSPMLTLLLERGGDPTLGIYNAASGGDASIVKLLLDHGANPNGVCTEGSSPLVPAIVLDHENVTKLLLNAGADPDHGGAADVSTLRAGVGMKSIDNGTLDTVIGATSGRATNLPPLVAAVALGRNTAVRLLLDAGADASLEADFDSPLDAAHAAELASNTEGHALLDTAVVGVAKDQRRAAPACSSDRTA